MALSDNKRYVARVHRYGARTYDLLGKPARSERVALQRLVEAMARNPDYNRGDVLMSADYYDPVPIFEVTQL
jgi:hypothetical protein